MPYSASLPLGKTTPKTPASAAAKGCSSQSRGANSGTGSGTGSSESASLKGYLGQQQRDRKAHIKLAAAYFYFLCDCHRVVRPMPQQQGQQLHSPGSRRGGLLFQIVKCSGTWRPSSTRSDPLAAATLLLPARQSPPGHQGQAPPAPRVLLGGVTAPAVTAAQTFPGKMRFPAKRPCQ